MSIWCSIIVPIYNCEKWLPQCIESLLNQTYPDFEIILIDDGSTDKSLEICQKYAKRDDRIRIYEKENGGVSSARNLGLSHAIGEWITFVDADDWLAPEVLEQLFQENERKKDFYMWNFLREENGKSKLMSPIYVEKISREELYAAIISGRKGNTYCLGGLIRGAGGKLFRRNILEYNQILFDERLYIGEDAVFILEYMQCLGECQERIKVLNIYGYHYRIHSGSAVQRYKSDLLEQSVFQHERVVELLKKNRVIYDKKVRTSLVMFEWIILNNLLRNEARKGDGKNISQYTDATHWYERYGKKMRSFGIEAWKLDEFTILQWGLSRILPMRWQFKIVLLYFEIIAKLR